MPMIYLLMICDNGFDGGASVIKAFKKKENAEQHKEILSSLIKECEKENLVIQSKLTEYFKNNPQPQSNHAIFKHDTIEYRKWKNDTEEWTAKVNSFTAALDDVHQNPKYKDIADYMYNVIEIDEIELED